MTNKKRLLKLNKQKLITGLVIILIVGSLIIIVGCLKKETIKYKQLNNMNDTIDGGAFPSHSPNLRLSIKDPPMLNQIGELEANIATYGKDSRVNIEIELPENIVLVDGDLSWYGEVIIPREELDKHKPPYGSDNPLPKGEIIHKIKFKVINAGNYTISGKINRLKLNGTEILKTIGISKIYVSVSENNSSVSEFPFPKPAICRDSYIDGELVQCTTSEPIGDFVETELP